MTGEQTSTTDTAAAILEINEAILAEFPRGCTRPAPCAEIGLFSIRLAGDVEAVIITGEEALDKARERAEDIRANCFTGQVALDGLGCFGGTRCGYEASVQTCERPQ